MRHLNDYQEARHHLRVCAIITVAVPDTGQFVELAYCVCFAS